MPIDDLRVARLARAPQTPVDEPAELELPDEDDDDLTPEQLAAIERDQLEEVMEIVADIDSGRDTEFFTWEEVRAEFSVPFTPEELATARDPRLPRARR